MGFKDRQCFEEDFTWPTLESNDAIRRGQRVCSEDIGALSGVLPKALEGFLFATDCVGHMGTFRKRIFHENESTKEVRSLTGRNSAWIITLMQKHPDKKFSEKDQLSQLVGLYFQDTVRKSEPIHFVQKTTW